MPKWLRDVRELAASEGWVHGVVVCYQGPNPSLDFCGKCAVSAVRTKVIARITGGERNVRAATDQARGTK